MRISDWSSYVLLFRSWTGHVDVTRDYSANGLNQYTAAGSASFTYDANGNLTSDGSTTYLYDIENRLVGESVGSSAPLGHDPIGRLYEGGAGSKPQRFLYVGVESTGIVVLRGRVGHHREIQGVVGGVKNK